MTRDQYVQTAPVRNFSAYLSQLLTNAAPFTHGYRHRQSKKDYRFNSLADALHQYEWKGDYPTTSRALAKMALALRESVAADKDQDCGAACTAILQWGGVNSASNKAGLAAVQARHGSLPAYFRWASEVLGRHDLTAPGIGPELPMTAGFTKLYALLLDDFIIYDSRVGGALGLLVRQWCEDQQLRQVPAELAFAYGAGRQTPSDLEANKSRNPSKGTLKFELLARDAPHTRHNMRANWLLADALQRVPADSAFGKGTGAERLRALEAALFMVGYDVR